MNWNDPNVSAAIVSAVVSVLVVLLSFLLKSLYERHFHLFKLESEHEYEQRKKMKEAVAKYKIRLIDAAESLSHRLWNLSANYDKGWHTTEDLSVLPAHYYLASFTYRLLSFYAWVRRFESEIVFLDGTIASKSDLEFVKFLKLFPHILCDASLFDGLGYESEFAKDHFFMNDLHNMCEQFQNEDGVVSFDEYKSDTNEVLTSTLNMAGFISGVSPDEERLRWDRLQALHYVLIMFLNSYGYEFQHTGDRKMKEIVSRTRATKVTKNLRLLLERYHLTENRAVKNAIRLIGGEN